MEDYIELFKETYPDSILNQSDLEVLFKRFNNKYDLVVKYYEDNFVDHSQASSESNFDFLDKDKQRKMNAFEFMEHNNRQYKRAEEFLKEKSRVLNLPVSEFLNQGNAPTTSNNFIDQNKHLSEDEFFRRLQAENEGRGRPGLPFKLDDRAEQSQVLADFKRHKRGVEQLLQETNEKYAIMNKARFKSHKDAWVREFFALSVGSVLDQDIERLGPRVEGVPEQPKADFEYLFLRLGTFITEETCFEKCLQDAPAGCMLEVFLEDNLSYLPDHSPSTTKRKKKKPDLPGRIYLRYRGKAIVSLKNSLCKELFLLLRKNYIKVAPWVSFCDRNLA